MIRICIVRLSLILLTVNKNVNGRDVMYWGKAQRGDTVYSSDMKPTRTGNIGSASMIYDSLRP